MSSNDLMMPDWFKLIERVKVTQMQEGISEHIILGTVKMGYGSKRSHRVVDQEKDPEATLHSGSPQLDNKEWENIA